MTKRSPTRRDFLKTAAAGTTAAFSPYFFSQPRSLADEIKSKNDRMNVGLIGSGGIAHANMNAAKDWLDIVAIADVDKSHREAFNKKFAGGKAALTEDYRDVIERDDVDVIHVATPDHWHTKPVVEAMLAGKDVYCEKPLTLTIDEGKIIRKIQKQTGRVVQVGTQQRSQFNLFTKAMAMVADGRLGQLKQVQAAIGGGPTCDALPVAEVPDGFNWDRWVGPTLEVDFLLKEAKPRPDTNGHYNFRWWYAFSGGRLTDWGAHHVDICNWALKLNDQSDGPTRIEGTATHPVEFKDGYPVEKDRYNTATKFLFTVSYPSGAEMIIRDDTENGVKLVGDKGEIFVSRRKLVGKPVDELKDNPLPEDAIAKVYRGMPMEGDGRKAHWANFLHCVRERQMPISDVHSHMQMLNVCHLAGISARLNNRPLQWDDAQEVIVGDEQANSFLSRPYRKGYEIEV
ncbi:putative oxidoreductase YcjS [Planctomycetes bacterium Pan216]|uniref:Putative oxidoreductase YcjS n=1 Tax=Kolteria novifilia TaxID=2527975 RepID=A0A518B814_9BACT|nr:putative oxidoreductase YcjS [Planctomycetes bacterium Pan216]